MMAAVVLMWGFVDRVQGLNIIAALVILSREIAVSGLREFLASLQVSVPVSQLAKWKTTFQLVALGALILAGAVPQWPWVHTVGLISLWAAAALTAVRSEEHTSELQSLMRISYAVFCLNKKKKHTNK